MRSKEGYSIEVTYQENVDPFLGPSPWPPDTSSKGYMSLDRGVVIVVSTIREFPRDCYPNSRKKRESAGSLSPKLCRRSMSTPQLLLRTP